MNTIYNLAAVSISYSGFSITWSGGNSSIITYSIAGIGAVIPNSSGVYTATFTGLPTMTSWPLTVIATYQTNSATAFLNILAPPSVITGVTASSIGLTGFTVSWSGGTGANGTSRALEPLVHIGRTTVEVKR